VNRNDAEKILEKKFNIKSFYDTQWEVIEKLLLNKRVLLIEKTGFGKSLCFQFSSLLKNGITIVFTPLIALMRDQVKKLRELGIKAELINYNMSESEIIEVMERSVSGSVKLLYISPERLNNNIWQDYVGSLNISMVVIDEAHCISVWGHDFRPDYQRIINLVKLLPLNISVLATTATATKRVEEDIKKQIGMDLVVFRGKLMRNNLSLNVIDVSNDEDKLIWLTNYIKTLDGSGIIYAGTRSSAEQINAWLKFNKINSVFYHAGLEDDKRIEIENGLMVNKYKCIVATNALGMGIDKNDIRFIIHTQIPQSPIHYYQEIGRAGRDGKLAKIFLLFNKDEDLNLPISFIETARPNTNKYLKVINILKNEVLGLKDIILKVDLKQPQVQLILNDLINQNIINKISYSGKIKYQYRYNAPAFSTKEFDLLKEIRFKELDDIKNYTDTKKCRMTYLCNYLGDNNISNCNNCDNDLNISYHVEKTTETESLINSFNYYPLINISAKENKAVNGFAVSYYGISKIGTIINKCKYINKCDFPDYIVSKTVELFNKEYKNEKYDFIVYVPPTESGDLVKNFAYKISKITGISIFTGIVKIKITKPQKSFQSAYNKKANVENAFSITENKLLGKRVLIIDDVYDNGATLKELAKVLTKAGVSYIRPIVIAKTVGGE